MNCLYCDENGQARAAIGLCARCSAGVCGEHSAMIMPKPGPRVVGVVPAEREHRMRLCSACAGGNAVENAPAAPAWRPWLPKRVA